MIVKFQKMGINFDKVEFYVIKGNEVTFYFAKNHSVNIYFGSVEEIQDKFELIEHSMHQEHSFLDVEAEYREYLIEKEIQKDEKELFYFNSSEKEKSC